ncbi:MAG TPA: acetyl-CoA carboxylase biotin carboxyl carrier protein [Bacillota bacterium]|nr:acetyl-CoA carboxylase biotin carboxyl carrier protein [Bacillota bacterium]
MLKVQEVREIIKLIDQSSINEFSYETNGTKIKLKKELGKNQSNVQPVFEQTKEVTEAIQTHVEAEEVSTPSNEDDGKNVNNPTSTQVEYDSEIVSPMVGTFYRRSSPENDPYVKEGSRVSADTVVCIVEAMKLFNEIESETTGEIVEILVEDGELVEYGQPLFRVKN